MAATCADGLWACPAPLIPAASCPIDSWPTGRLAGCGPWVSNYDCVGQAVCSDGFWMCPSDGGSLD